MSPRGTASGGSTATSRTASSRRCRSPRCGKRPATNWRTPVSRCSAATALWVAVGVMQAAWRPQI
jgi:hypothetical protein